MISSIMYHEGNRRLQDQFESRRIADRLEAKLTRTAFTDDDRQFIEGTIIFSSQRPMPMGVLTVLSRVACRVSCA